MIRTIVPDKTTAIFAAQAITAALFARERTGEGQHIRLAMLDTMIAYLWPEAMTQYTAHWPPSLRMTSTGLGWRSAGYRPVRTRETRSSV